MELTEIKSTQLTQSLFLLEKDEKTILFAPLDIIAIQVKEKGKSALIEHFIEGKENPVVKQLLKEKGINKNYPVIPINLELFKPISLNLALTSACNLHCVYCYARAGLNPVTMSFELVKSSIDFIVNNALDLRKDEIRISFLAGGETLVVFKLLEKVVEYATSKWDKKIVFSIVTNGTLITPEIAKFLLKNNFRISVSVDGPEELHNQNRPKNNGEGSFKDCMRGLEYLRNSNCKNLLIRSTITYQNINNLKDLVDIANKFGTRLKFEPVTPTGRGEDTVEELSAPLFLEKYTEAKEYANKVGVELSSTYDHDFSPRVHFCSGNGRMFCVLPGSEITSCSRITRPDDLLADQYFIGKLNSEGPQLIIDRLQNLRQLNVLSFRQCEECFAKWYCAGGCHATRLSNNMEMPNTHCDIVKQLLWANLVKNFDL
ncbi:MAG: radical SAM protein [Candidatus Dojkabacteria bacterium]|nr:radical SAM protein [Candidatus Dojkabacteria bacterium]